MANHLLTKGETYMDAMTAKDLQDFATALKKLREAGDSMFSRYSEGCPHNWGRGYNEGKCMHEKSKLKMSKRPDGRPLRRFCCLRNCPEL